MPDVRVDWTANSRGRLNRFVITEDDVLHEGGSWPMRVKVLLGYESRPPEVLAVTLNGTGKTVVREALGRPRPSYVFANFGDYGYGRFLLDRSSRDFVLGHIGTIGDDFERAVLWGSLWDSVREAELAPEAYVKLAMQQVTSERDEVTVQNLLGRISTAYNRYLSDVQARGLAQGLEHLLSDQMMHAPSPGLRITYFRAFQSVATTEEARELLKKILRGDVVIPGMTMRPRDRYDVITALLARRDTAAPDLLQAEAQNAKTDDERRYAYAAGAAKGDAATKESYFNAYLNDIKVPESWIEASLTSFNTVQQSALTFPYLAPALRELPKLKRTRKIFFINNWLAAFIGGQCNQNSIITVEGFLEQEKSLDRDLRLKVLESADGLERCVRIRNKFTN
jgi:aminopeptidase N